MRSRRRSVSRNRPLVAARASRAAMRRGPNTVGAPEGIQHRGLAGGEFHAAGANLLVVDVQRVRIRVRARRRGDGVPPVGRWSATRRGRGRPTRRANDASGVEDACAGGRDRAVIKRQPPRDARRARPHRTRREPRTRRTSPRARRRLRPAPANPKVETPRTKDVVGVMTRVIRDDWSSYFRRRAPTTTAVDMIKRSSLTNTFHVHAAWPRATTHLTKVHPPPRTGTRVRMIDIPPARACALHASITLRHSPIPGCAFFMCTVTDCAERPHATPHLGHLRMVGRVDFFTTTLCVPRVSFSNRARSFTNPSFGFIRVRACHLVERLRRLRVSSRRRAARRRWRFDSYPRNSARAPRRRDPTRALRDERGGVVEMRGEVLLLDVLRRDAQT